MRNSVRRKLSQLPDTDMSGQGGHRKNINFLRLVETHDRVEDEIEKLGRINLVAIGDLPTLIEYSTLRSRSKNWYDFVKAGMAGPDQVGRLHPLYETS